MDYSVTSGSFAPRRQDWAYLSHDYTLQLRSPLHPAFRLRFTGQAMKELATEYPGILDPYFAITQRCNSL
jgi:hypothetical protein